MAFSSPAKRARAEGVNDLSPKQIDAIISELRTKGHIISVTRDGVVYDRCTLATTGVDKHAQCTITKHVGASQQRKELVHLIYWRQKNAYALIPSDAHISHLDADHKILHLTSESAALNESRKHCHAFGWWRVDPLQGRPRCPHWEVPCTGPQ